MTMLTAHFTLDEMLVSQEAARKGWDNMPPTPAITNLRRLCAEVLEPIRHLIGDRPVVVSSGYRSPQLNPAIGGAPTSAHLDGRAADFTVPGVPLVTLYEEIARAGLPIDQLIFEYGRWIHAGIARVGSEPRRQLLMKLAGRGYEPFDLNRATAAAS